VLLLAAVALMPVMGMAQGKPSEKDVRQKFEREMRLRQYTDSVERARLTQLYAHQEEMARIADKKFSTMRGNLPNIIILLIVSCAILGIVYIAMKNSRRKAEDHKELINKLIDNNLLNSSEPISKDTIEALMKPNKSDKERYIFDATLLGIGIAASFISVVEHLAQGFILISFILAGIGLLRIVTRATFSYFENKNAQKKAAEAVREPKAKPIEEAEVIEEK
jgi:predicted nucleic-acid-binding protein